MAVTQIVDIVEGIIAKLDCDITITNNVDNGGGNHVLSMANTYYMTKLKEITIDGFNYKVVDFVFNSSITIEPIGHTTPVTVTTFNLPAPLFFHGTVVTTDKEVQLKMENEPNSYPIVYLFENITENFSGVGSLEEKERDSPITLYFLDISNYKDNCNEDYLTDVLKPLSNIECKYFEVLEFEKGIGDLVDTYQRTNLSKFARLNENGETELIFSEELSAVSISMTLPVIKC